MLSMFWTRYIPQTAQTSLFLTVLYCFSHLHPSGNRVCVTIFAFFTDTSVKVCWYVLVVCVSVIQSSLETVSLKLQQHMIAHFRFPLPSLIKERRNVVQLTPSLNISEPVLTLNKALECCPTGRNAQERGGGKEKNERMKVWISFFWPSCQAKEGVKEKERRNRGTEQWDACLRVRNAL